MLKKIINSLIVICTTLFIGYLALVVVNLIPQSVIRHDVTEAAYKLEDEGLYPTIFGNRYPFYDNVSEAVFLSVCFDERCSNNPFVAALDANIKVRDKAGIDGLVSSVSGEAIDEVNYSRYWNGYQIWMKPLFCKYGLGDVREICFGINLCMFLLFSFLCYKKVGFKILIPFAITYIFFNFELYSMCFQFFGDIFVMLLGCILILLAKDFPILKRNMEVVFVFIGTLTAFLSTLNMPMITVGIPVILWMVCNEEKPLSTLILGIKNSAFWLAGYAITVFSKVLLSGILFDSLDGVDRVKLYSSADSFSERISITMDLFKKAFTYFHAEAKIDILWFIGIITILVIVLTIKGKKVSWLKYAPILFVGLYPFVWCLVVTGHTVHGWTICNYSIFLFAIAYILSDIVCYTAPEKILATKEKICKKVSTKKS